MKYSLVIVLCLLVGSSYSLPKFVNVAEDDCGQNDVDGLGPFVKHIFGMIPLDQVLSIAVEYLSEDPEVINAFIFIQSEEFSSILLEMQKMDDFVIVLEFFCVNLKLNVYYYMNAIGDLIGLPLVTRPPHSSRLQKSSRLQPGLQGMLNEIIAVLPTDDMLKYYYDQLENNEYVQLAIENLKSDHFRIVSENVEKLPEFQLMVSRLEEIGFDTNAIIRKMKEWLGFPLY